MYKIAFILLPLIFSACEKEEIRKEVKTPVNSLSMKVNGEYWEPSVPDGDSCRSTFYCLSGGWINTDGAERPFYEIYSYKDPNALDDYRSENQFRFQIMNVKQPGIYPITGFYGFDTEPYAIFVLNKDGVNKRYVNKTNEISFIATVNELVPTKLITFTGIKGFFQGTLYNEKDPLDSLVITNGQFTFKTGNGVGHCDGY